MYYGECSEHGVVKAIPCKDDKGNTHFCCSMPNEGKDDVCGIEVSGVRYVHYTDTSLAEDEKRHCDVRCVVGTVSCNCKCGGLCHGLGRCICGN